MGLVVVDTSILIAFLDSSDPFHATAREAVSRARARHILVAPVLVYAETLVGPFRRGEMEVEVAERFFDEAAVCVEPLTRSMARTGASLRARHGLRLPDSLIIATGLALDARAILTTDRRWAGVDRRIRVLSAPD